MAKFEKKRLKTLFLPRATTHHTHPFFSSFVLLLALAHRLLITRPFLRLPQLQLRRLGYYRCSIFILMLSERLGRLIVLDPPFWMRGIYHGIRPFLSQTTRDKIQMVSSSSYTSTSPSASASSVSVDDQQIQTIMNRWRRRGTQSSTDDTGTRATEDVDDEDDYLSSPVDVHRYLYDTPFFCPYGSNRNCED